MNKIFLTIILLITAAIPALTNKIPEMVYIEWKPVEGALSYTVEILDNFDDLIMIKKTTSVKLELSLPYGRYKYRIGIFTKFGKISEWSEWYNLIVVPALRPEILSVMPTGLLPADGNKVIIKGKNFYKSSELTIKKGDKTLKVKNLKLIDRETLSLDVDASGTEAGSTFDLLIKNTGDLLDLEASAPDQFTILTKDPAKDPIKDPIKDPVKDPIKDPVKDPVKDPIKDPVKDPVKDKGLPIAYYTGLEFGYYSKSLGIKDPYSGSLGFKLYSEFRSLGNIPLLSFLNKAPGFYPGVLLEVSGFMAPRSDFGSSSMLQLGLYFGYEFSFPLKDKLRWHVAPYLGLKQYLRWHVYQNVTYFGSRPAMFLGANVTFDLPKRFFIGVALEYNIIFESSPVHVLGTFIRCGYRF